jgi:hypothetical protein
MAEENGVQYSISVHLQTANKHILERITEAEQPLLRPYLPGVGSLLEMEVHGKHQTLRVLQQRHLIEKGSPAGAQPVALVVEKI